MQGIRFEDKGVLRDKRARLFNYQFCYQCRRCTNGCPLTFAMDIYPDRVIRLLNLGLLDRILHCTTIWICSSCKTCTTRCPNQVDIAGVMDYLKEKAIEKGITPPEKATLVFHESFLKEIEKRGRVFEAGLMQRYMLMSRELPKKLRDGSIKEDVKMGINLLLKGRMPLLPESIKGRGEVKEIIRKRP